MEQDRSHLQQNVSAAKTEEAVRATIQHYRQTEEALSECHLRGFISIFSLSPWPSLFVCPHSDNLCNAHKENSKETLVWRPAWGWKSSSRRWRVCARPSADGVFSEETIADIILFACGLSERSQSAGVKGGEQCKDSSSITKVHRLVLMEFSSL